jgi:LTXXQ motif family protein
MKDSRVAIGAIVLLSVAALVMPLTAAHAFGRGGGGGGGHFGGGGGGHFGGGGGGFHFGGGGMHLGGGGLRLGGLSHLGGRHIGGGHIGGLHVGGAHLGGGRNVGGLNLGHGLSGVGRGGNSLAGRQALHGRRLAGLGAGALGTHAFAHNNRFGSDRFGRNGFGHDRFGRFGGDRFGHFGRFGGGFGGWVGPVFWPYAYSDIYCDVFWGYWGYGCADPYWGLAFGNPFWDYGYGDIFDGGIFSPYGFGDLAGYLPGATSAGRRTRSNVATASEQIAEMCGNDTREVADWPIDRIRQLVSPNGQQSMALDDLANASVQAAQMIKNACPTSVAFTPTGRLAAMQQRIEAMEQAVDVIRGPLDRFYSSLTDEQKAKLNAANQASAEPNARAAELVQSCSKNAATDWPEARIEAAVRPNEDQEAKLKALQSAATQAAQRLAASCPSELPTTPPARLAAVSKRLDVMLQAVKSVRVALDNFYADLSDEQKAQFDKIGPSRTAQR